MNLCEGVLQVRIEEWLTGISKLRRRLHVEKQHVEVSQELASSRDQLPC